MRTDSVVKRLKAWVAGRPLPLGETIHFPIARERDLLMLAFVRMGGESAPWGIAFGHPGESLRISCVPEPRKRTLVAQMVAGFAPVLLHHFRHPQFIESKRTITTGASPPQLWLPNPTHLEMLHHLAYAYTFARTGEPDRVALLNALGRLCGWLFREAQRPAQVSVMVATEALRSAYEFPVEDVRQAHLGYLLAWLETPGDLDDRLQAAAVAERESIATSLDPLVERDELQPLLEGWNEAEKAGEGVKEETLERAVSATLARELGRRLNVVERTLAVVAADRRRINRGVGELVRLSLDELDREYLQREQRILADPSGRVFVPSPETDRNPAAAAARYYMHEEYESIQETALAQDDVEVLEQILTRGDGLRGTITHVRDEGTGRRSVPVWRLLVPEIGPLRVREGSELAVLGLSKRQVRVREIRRADAAKLEVEVQVVALVTRPRSNAAGVLAATDHRLEGTTVMLVPTSRLGISRLRASKVWEAHTPGAWLTHKRPAPDTAA